MEYIPLRQCRKCRRPIGIQPEWEDLGLAQCVCPPPQKPDQIQVSTKAWTFLLNKAEIPIPSFRQTAKGISDWLSLLFITTNPTDTRPEWAKQEWDRHNAITAHLQRSNIYEKWVCSNRHPRSVIFMEDAKARIVDWAIQMELFTKQLTYTALAGALLDCVGREWITPTHWPPPANINLQARARAMKQHLQENDYSIRRAERYLDSNAVHK